MSSSNPMIDKIEHVVVVMLENRGFDSVLGYLYGKDDLPKQNIPALQSGEQPFHGLAFVDPDSLKNPKDGVAPGPVVRATNTPGWDPGEEYEHVNVQLFGSGEAPESGTEPEMKGFLEDYATRCEGDSDAVEQIMRMYTPADLPILSGLAKGYAASDLWFSSVPTQTNANRAFSLCGASAGLVDNGWLTTNAVDGALANDRFLIPTIWNVLAANGFDDWAVFWEVAYPPVISSLPYTRNLFPELEKIPNIDQHFQKTENFFELARAGRLPKYSYIEPGWGGYAMGFSIMGNEYHPPADVSPGEFYLEKIYESLISNQSAWENTLLVITFDEHGGAYDHYPPPWGAAPPWGSGTPDAPNGLQYDFQFDRFGVRVPAILVSPRIEAGTVFRSPAATPYDHTSVIATLLKWLLPDLPRDHWGLGERVFNAPTFENVLTLDTPRTDNVLAPVIPEPGTPLKFGDPFYLKHMAGEFVIGAHSGVRYYFPKLGPEGAVALDFRFGFGEVPNEATVQVRTSEDLPPALATSPYFINYPAIRNFLGAWHDEHDCYYYSTNDAENYKQQYWTVSRIDGGGGGPLQYGDKITLTSNDFTGQSLVKNGEYLSTASGASEWWSIEPIAAPPPDTPV